MSTKCATITTISTSPEADLSKQLGTQLQEYADIIEGFRDIAIKGTQQDDHSKYAETLDRLQGDENRAARIAYLAQFAGGGELQLGEQERARENFNRDIRDRFGWLEHALPDGTSVRYRLGTVEDGVMILSTLADENTHGSYFNDTELRVLSTKDGSVFISKNFQKSNRSREIQTPDDDDIQIVRDGIARLCDIAYQLKSESAQ